MYLKRLEMQGFKSFASSTALDFLTRKNHRHSITAIVGPNGAGKSNIADAIRWVMGEQSLKAIRGKKSEDIIFGGSDTKSQLGMAEVSMILDNSQPSSIKDFGGASDKLMDDFPEITITRRLYRSGESEYFINNNPVRLLDVHLLLAKAQFAEQSYTIVGQGMIDRLLTVSPLERKDFLDEASGIKEHQIKHHQAELRLARSKENMTQAERLTREVEPRLRILSRQVKKLEKRQEVEIRLREAQESYFASLYERNKAELDALEKRLEVAEEGYRDTFKTLQNIQQELAALAHSATQQELFEKLQAEHQKLVSENNELERQSAVKEGQMQIEYGKSGKQNVSWICGKLSELKIQKNSANGQLAELARESGAGEALARESARKVNELLEEKISLQREAAELERKFLDGQSEKRYSQMAGLSAIQAVLSNKQKFGKIFGVLAELGQVEEKYRAALEAAAGSYLSALVTEDDESSRLAIEYLRQNHLGVATFLPLNKLTPKILTDEETRSFVSGFGVIGRALDLIRFDPKFERAFKIALGQTLIVENLSAAQRVGIGNARMATLQGDIVEKRGVMRGGHRHEKKGIVGFARRLSSSADMVSEYQNQLNVRKERIVKMEEEIEVAKSALATCQVAENGREAKAGVLRESSQSLEREVAHLEQELALQEAGPEAYSALLFRLQEEKQNLFARIQVKEQGIAESEKKLRRFNEEEEKKKQRVFKLQDAAQTIQSSLNDILGKRNDINVSIAKYETKLETVRAETYAELHETVESIINRKPQLVEMEWLGEIVNEIQKLKYQLSLIGGIDEEVFEEYKQTKERYDFLSTQIADLKAAVEDLETMIVELDEIMKKKREAAFKKIRKEFSRYFAILFGGGKADIKEIYGDAAEDAAEERGEQAELGKAEIPRPQKRREKLVVGIDIEVSPPGKKIKNVNMLSGGERTLASIALICAILNYNPSPFVVLDEVEAALDESNTRRFVEIVSELSTRSQFILITHNRVTMHAVDALYGVVMSGDGISKLLSVRLEEAEKYGEKAGSNIDK